MKPRNDIVDKLSTKRELRRSRRNRKTRYRQARFNNRKTKKMAQYNSYDAVVRKAAADAEFQQKGFWASARKI